MKIVVFSLGCKVNQYESDALIARLKEKGFEVSEKLEKADVYILNSCAVTAEAERKSRQCVTRFLNLNPKAKVFVCGCASENNAKQFCEKEDVCYVVGTSNKMSIVDRVGDLSKKIEFEKNSTCNQDSIFEEMGNSLSPRTRHYIKVQDGCNNFCSYCLIPYLRGRERSRKIEDVKKEFSFASQHSKEIVLTGINLSAYGKDLGISLIDLLDQLTEFETRIRLGSLEVGIVSDELLKTTQKLKNFCPHFHLSLQSGDDTVLKSMNRHYTTEDYFDAVKKIRKYYPNAGITTDVIVGFPTETDELFENTKKFVEKVEFSDIHIFSYSPRKGTVASKMKALPNEVLFERHKDLENLKNKLKEKFNSKFLQKPLDVLFEQSKNGVFSGHTKEYITVYSDDNNAVRGEISTIIPSEIFQDGIK